MGNQSKNGREKRGDIGSVRGGKKKHKDGD